jgi:hypothetical protein
VEQVEGPLHQARLEERVQRQRPFEAIVHALHVLDRHVEPAIFFG